MRNRTSRTALTILIAILLGPEIASGQSAPSARPEKADPGATVALTPATFGTWRDRLQPTETELAFRSIPWRTDLARAVADAERTRRPVLLWLMNGHPLGPT